MDSITIIVVSVALCVIVGLCGGFLIWFLIRRQRLHDKPSTQTHRSATLSTTTTKTVADANVYESGPCVVEIASFVYQDRFRSDPSTYTPNPVLMTVPTQTPVLKPATREPTIIIPDNDGVVDAFELFPSLKRVVTRSTCSQSSVSTKSSADTNHDDQPVHVYQDDEGDATAETVTRNMSLLRRKASIHSIWSRKSGKRIRQPSGVDTQPPVPQDAGLTVPVTQPEVGTVGRPVSSTFSFTVNDEVGGGDVEVDPVFSSDDEDDDDGNMFLESIKKSGRGELGLGSPVDHGDRDKVLAHEMMNSVIRVEVEGLGGVIAAACGIPTPAPTPAPTPGRDESDTLRREKSVSSVRIRRRDVEKSDTSDDDVPIGVVAGSNQVTRSTSLYRTKSRATGRYIGTNALPLVQPVPNTRKSVDGRPLMPLITNIEPKKMEARPGSAGAASSVSRSMSVSSRRSVRNGVVRNGSVKRMMSVPVNQMSDDEDVPLGVQSH